MIPQSDGATHSLEWKEAAWDKIVTGAPRPRTPSEQQYREENGRLRRLLAGAMLDNAVLKEVAAKKLVKLAAQRKAVEHARQLFGIGERRACTIFRCLVPAIGGAGLR